MRRYLLREKREIVRRFKAGEPLLAIALGYEDLTAFDCERIVRFFMLGKFKLKPGRRK